MLLSIRICVYVLGEDNNKFYGRNLVNGSIYYVVFYIRFLRVIIVFFILLEFFCVFGIVLSMFSMFYSYCMV